MTKQWHGMHATHKIGSACLLTKVRRAHEYIVPSLHSSFDKSEAPDVVVRAALSLGPPTSPRFACFVCFCVSLTWLYAV